MTRLGCQMVTGRESVTRLGCQTVTGRERDQIGVSDGDGQRD